MSYLLAFRRSGRLFALAEVSLVMLIWGGSFVFVKVGLDYMGPLTLAGLRYFLAFLLLLPLLMARGSGAHRARSGRLWLYLLLIGLSSYTIGNGAFYWSLYYLSATTASFILGFLPILVLFIGTLWLREIPTRRQVLGVLAALCGSWLFFSGGLTSPDPLGLLLAGIGLFSFLLFGILGRQVARERHVDTLSLTAIPLAFGGGLTLVISLFVEGPPSSELVGWGIVLMLAVVNTACAYMLYNHALQTLTALEINAMLNFSPLATALLAWLLLGERLTPVQLAGMLVVIGGVVMVQWRRQQKAPLAPVTPVEGP